MEHYLGKMYENFGVGPLSALFCACVIGMFVLLCLPKRLHTLYGYVSLCTTMFAYSWSLLLWVFFDRFSLEMQFLEIYPTLLSKNLQISFGVDGLSLFFLLLTTLLFPLCILAGWTVADRQYLFVNILCIEILLLLSFTVLDLFYFCCFFESIVLPMFFIILFWGVRARRIFAITYFFMYTLLGSVFLFWALFILYFEIQTTSYFALFQVENSGHLLSVDKQRLLWLLLFLTFAIKIPIFPLHIWLPEAHVEAPTVGSVVLAGLLLKLGGYGMLRFLFLFEEPRYFFQPFAITICLFSVFYGSYMALVQKDLKKIIAYSSVAHMNFALLGFFSNNFYGLVGGMCLMISHGFVSSALFFLIGMLYERYHDRAVEHYGGLVQLMPVFITIFFIFIISNFSFPLTSNFVGEFLVLLGLATSANLWVLFLAAVSTFFGLVYSMLLFNRIAFGQLKLPNYEKFRDVSRLEFYYMSPLLTLNLVFGVFPSIVLSTLFFTFQKYVKLPGNPENDNPEEVWYLFQELPLIHPQLIDGKVAYVPIEPVHLTKGVEARGISDFSYTKESAVVRLFPGFVEEDEAIINSVNFGLSFNERCLRAFVSAMYNEEVILMMMEQPFLRYRDQMDLKDYAEIAFWGFERVPPREYYPADVFPGEQEFANMKFCLNYALSYYYYKTEEAKVVWASNPEFVEIIHNIAALVAIAEESWEGLIGLPYGFENMRSNIAFIFFIEDVYEWQHQDYIPTILEFGKMIDQALFARVFHPAASEINYAAEYEWFKSFNTSLDIEVMGVWSFGM